MKVVVSASRQDPSSDVDPRFGRCPYFIVTDTGTGEFTAVANKGLEASGGAGIAAAQQVAALSPDAVLTGHCGPNAFSVLEKASIKVYANVTGTVSEAIEKLVRGSLTPASSPDSAPHSGMGGHQG